MLDWLSRLRDIRRMDTTESKARPSGSELRVLRALWRLGRSSAREVHDSKEWGWSYSTTRKLLDRMVEKGLVAIESVHGMKTFVASVNKVETLAALIRDFARDVLDADGPLPAAAFAQSRLLEPEEIEELEALLAEEEDPS